MRRADSKIDLKLEEEETWETSFIDFLEELSLEYLKRNILPDLFKLVDEMKEVKASFKFTLRDFLTLDLKFTRK